MVTNAFEPEPEPEVTLADRLVPLGEATRVLVTGTASGPWRRAVLFIVIAVALAFTTPSYIGAFGLAALVALVWTDQIVAS